MVGLRFYLYILVTAIALSCLAYGQSESYREYSFLFGSPEELEPVAAAGTSLNKMFQDIYFRGFGPRLPERVQPFVEVGWSVYWTYFFSLWPHEFGHWARARQVGGDFLIHSVGFPFPEAEMSLPADLGPEEGILPSIGGHEINSLMLQQAQFDFYNRDYAYADELIHAFIQEVYFPFYAFVIAPSDPFDSLTWVDTRGDPVESTLSVFENLTGRAPVDTAGWVDPLLSAYYRETIYLSLLWAMLDPFLYQSLEAFGADLNEDHGLMRPQMLGNEKLSWYYGTQFNQSPLGYELYFTNYLRMWQKFAAIYFKFGKPFENNGIGIRVPDLIETRNITVGVACDLWDQAIYDIGTAVSVDIRYQSKMGLGLILKGSWKDDGYLIGRRLEESTTFFAGFSYRY